MNIETLSSIFTIENGNFKILLFKKENDPYKGYWTLPSSIVEKDQSIEDSITNLVIEKVGLSNLWLEQNYTYGSVDRSYDNRVVSINYIGLIDFITIDLKMQNNNIEKEWFKITELPKLAYDHEKIIEKSINSLKTKIKNISILKILFPSDFTLPEIQKVYEDLLEIKMDRRNFRKKLIEQEIIEETGEFNDGGTGRPAKLYRFKENKKERNII